MNLRHGVTGRSVVFVLFLLPPAFLWAEGPKRGGTLRIGYWQDMTGMDPHTRIGIPAVYVMRVAGNFVPMPSST
jgi:hypothetical protein